jgi:hypothetical protein
MVKRIDHCPLVYTDQGLQDNTLGTGKIELYNLYYNWCTKTGCDEQSNKVNQAGMQF